MLAAFAAAFALSSDRLAIARSSAFRARGNDGRMRLLMAAAPRMPQRSFPIDNDPHLAIAFVGHVSNVPGGQARWKRARQRAAAKLYNSVAIVMDQDQTSCAS